ncbi:hypothetical protein GCM10009775_20730 [Microbacterium aoyamense]|uniref:HTH luxR-type domain-containing protein n=1 Tax=Microbacterium aoyamense TaxID=344166 RepID=A0ABP5B2P5_9MICO|nr:LuxR C-terminal-related transcriptional regulator [Microbacterium aoyamense]
MTPARVRSDTARSLDRALFAIAALSLLVVVIEVAVLLQTVQLHAIATLALPFGFAVYVIAGIIAWRRRPSNAMGALMVWTGAAVLLGGIASTEVPVLEAIGAVFATVALAAVIHLVLAFPTGRLETPAARWTVAAAYFVSLVLQMPLYLLDPGSPLAVADAPGVVAIAKPVQSLAGAAVTVSAVVILSGRLRRAEDAHRRLLIPLLAYSIFAVLFTPVRSLLRAFVPIDPLLGDMLQFLVLAGVPIAFVFGLLRGGFPRTGGLEELGTWLGEASATDDRLAEVLSRALGDPSLALYVSSEQSGALVDADGREAPPRNDPRRGWSDISAHGVIVGAIAYDAELITDAALVAAAGSIVAIAVERERLSADLRATKQAALVSQEQLVSTIGALTPRQREVLELVAEGRSNASIAAKLVLTEKAVVQHVSRIYDALGLPMHAEAHRRVQAVVLYLTAQEDASGSGEDLGPSHATSLGR